MSLINIEKTVTLDVYDHDTTPSVVKTIQLDTGTRTIFAMIQNSRQDYDIGQNATVSLTVLRPDKTKVQITGQPFISYTGTDSTMYGAKAELSDVALAVKGNLKAQFKITSGVQELRTEIFTINNGEALDAGDGDWAGDLDGHNLDEMAESIETLQTDMAAVNEDVSDLKEGLTNVEGEVFTEQSVWNEVTLGYESGKFWSRAGVNDTFSKAKRSTNLVPVTPGEILRITTRISTNIPGVVYFNSSTFSQNTFVGFDLYELEGSTTREYTDVEVTVPAGAEYIVLQGRPNTTPFALKKNSVEYVSRLDGIEESAEEYTSDNDFEVKNLERRATSAENRNPFAWAAFDKSYFVFIHDDTNEHLETYANVFHAKGVPMGAATIPQNIDDTHLATLQQIAADGGEVLGHYNASPTESSSDATWMSCTGDVKKALEAYGFEVHGLIKANNTASSTDKGQKYCQRYYDYADNHLGKTEQFNFPRTLMLKYDSLSAFKARIDALENVNGIHAFGFHGGREDEAWITPEAFSEIIDYIQAKTNCEITTYYNLWQTFSSSVLAERIKALES